MSSEIDMDYYIFDDPTVQSILLALYSLVFIFCFFGNLTVVLVMAFHWRMQSITKYCIGNLAFANMCVGIFCVYQNFTLFIMGSWPYGNFLCKMFHFVNGLSHTASILILVVISVERYYVVLHPFKCRRILTIKRLRLIMLGVWVLSGILNLPRILYVVLIRNPRVSEKGEVTDDVICSIGSHLFPSETMEMIQFLLLFILPLMVISVLYYKIGMFLYQREAFSQAFVSASLFEYENELSEQSTQTQMSSENLPSSSRKALKPPFKIENGERNKQSNLDWCETQNGEINGFQNEGEIEFMTDCEEQNQLGNPGRIEFMNEKKGNFKNEKKNECQKNLERNTFKNQIEIELDGENSRSKPTQHSLENNTTVPVLPKTNSSNLWGKISGKRLRFLRRTQPGRRFWKSSKPKVIKCHTKCSNCRQHLHQHKMKGQCCYLTKPEAFKHGMRRIHGLTSKGGKIQKSGSLRSLHCPSNLVRINFSGSAVCCKDCGFFCYHSKLASPHRSHKNVVKLLVTIVVTFAVCNFPYHLRKIYQNYFYKPEYESDFDELATPVTFLLMYANCAINPIVYAFLSKNFRSCLMDVVRCNCKKTSYV